jgi:protein TonB
LLNPEAAEIQTPPPARMHIQPSASERIIAQPDSSAPAPAVSTVAEATAILTAAPVTAAQPNVESRPVPAATNNPMPVREPSRTADPGALAGYNRAVAQAVDRFKRYPRLALMRNWQGTALLKLSIGGDGRVREYHLAHSSGFDTLDEQALEMLRLAMPLPSLPTQLAGIDLSIDIPVVFRIAD